MQFGPPVQDKFRGLDGRIVFESDLFQPAGSVLPPERFVAQKRGFRQEIGGHREKRRKRTIDE